MIICGCMFGSVMNSNSIAQTRGAPILYLACFLLAGLLCCCLQSRQALRLSSDEFPICRISPDGLVLHQSILGMITASLTHVFLTIVFIAFLEGRGIQPAAARLGRALLPRGPGSKGFARTGHEPCSEPAPRRRRLQLPAGHTDPGCLGVGGRKLTASRHPLRGRSEPLPPAASSQQSSGSGPIVSRLPDHVPPPRAKARRSGGRDGGSRRR